MQVRIVDVWQLMSSVKYWQPNKMYLCPGGLTINIIRQTLRVRRGLQHVHA